MEAQKKDPNSLYAFYKKMIALRKSGDFQELFIYGSFDPLYEDEPGVIAYRRSYDGRSVAVINNAKPAEAALTLPGTVKSILLSNYDTIVINSGTIRLKRYQTVVVELL